MRDENFHAQELRNLLNHIVIIHNDNPEKEQENRKRQFGEFCRSLVSYIEKYLKREDKVQIESFMGSALALQESLYSKTDRTPFNLSLSRQLFVEFPRISSFKSTEDFNFFLDAIAKVSGDAGQQQRFEDLKERAASLIDPVAHPAALRIRVPDSQLARHSPAEGDGVARRVDFAEDPVEELDLALKKELGVEQLNRDHESCIGNLRIEGFDGFDSFSRFLQLAFGEERKVELLEGWRSTGIDFEQMFEKIQDERAAAQVLLGAVSTLDESLLGFVKLAEGAGGGVSSSRVELENAQQFSESDYVSSRCAVEGESISDFIKMSNTLLQLGHQLRKELISYEESLILLESEESGETLSSRHQIAMKEPCLKLSDQYTEAMEHLINLARNLQLPAEIQEDLAQNASQFRSVIEGAKANEIDLYYYQFIDILDAIEVLNFDATNPDLRGTSLLRGALETLRIFDLDKQDQACKKLSSFDRLNLSLVRAERGPVPQQKTRVDCNVLLSADDLNRSDPLPPIPISRAYRRMPIDFADPEVVAMFSVVPKISDSLEPETAICALRGAFDTELGFNSDQDISLAFASSLDSFTPNLAFLPAKVNKVLQRELELGDYLYQASRVAESSDSELEAGLRCGDVHVTRGLMLDLALHVVQPPPRSSLQVQIKELVLNYFRVIKSFNELHGVTESEKILFLPLFPLIQQQEDGSELKDHEQGAYLAVIALMWFRHRLFQEGHRYRIVLLPDLSVNEATQEQISSWFRCEWNDSLLDKILNEFDLIAGRHQSPVSIRAMITQLMGPGGWDAWFGNKEEAKRIVDRASASPYLGHFDEAQYCDYIRATNDVVASKRFSQLKAAWDSEPTAPLPQKVLGILRSYNNLSLWKHHRVRVNDFVGRVQAEGLDWTAEKISDELGELYRLILNDFVHGDSSYTAQQLIRGSFMSRYFLLRQELLAFIRENRATPWGEASPENVQVTRAPQSSLEGVAAAREESPEMVGIVTPIFSGEEGAQSGVFDLLASVSHFEGSPVSSEKSDSSPPRVVGDAPAIVVGQADTREPRRRHSHGYGCNLFGAGQQASAASAGLSPGGRSRSNSEGLHNIFSRPSPRGEGDPGSDSRHLLEGVAASVTAGDRETELLATDHAFVV